MQLDNPQRGFTWKSTGPLDMRMNPSKGASAAQWLLKISTESLQENLIENSDEPHAVVLAAKLAGRHLETTTDLADAIREAIANQPQEEIEKAVRRVFQAVRIAVNEEFTALDTLLRHLPACLNPGGRVAIMSFHSGEDRRVKKSFQAGLRDGAYSSICKDVIRPGAAECRANPRSTAAKLRWAVRAV